MGSRGVFCALVRPSVMHLTTRLLILLSGKLFVLRPGRGGGTWFLERTPRLPSTYRDHKRHNSIRNQMDGRSEGTENMKMEAAPFIGVVAYFVEAATTLCDRSS